MGATGFEQPSNSSGKTAKFETRGAKSGALLDHPIDLAKLIAAWPRLTVSARSAIITLAMASIRSD
jgi:hypothetical protein